MSTSSKQVFLEYWLPWIMGQAGSWWLPMAQNHLQEDSNSLLASLACYANFAIFITGSLLEKQRKLFTKECCLNGQRRLLWIFHEGWEGITDIRKQWWCSVLIHPRVVVLEGSWNLLSFFFMKIENIGWRFCWKNVTGMYLRASLLDQGGNRRSCFLSFSAEW